MGNWPLFVNAVHPSGVDFKYASLKIGILRSGQRAGFEIRGHVTGICLKAGIFPGEYMSPNFCSDCLPK